MLEENAQCDEDQGYEIAKKFLTDTVRVFLCNGSVLSGRLTEIHGKFIFVDNGNKAATINLDHVASMTRI